jgi:hypothetical protein
VLQTMSKLVYLACRLVEYVRENVTVLEYLDLRNRKQHEWVEERHSSYFSPNRIMVINLRRMGGWSMCHLWDVHICWEPLEKGLTGRLDLNGKVIIRNIRTCLKEIDWEIVDWSNFAQDYDQWGGGLFWTLGESSCSKKCGECCD